MHASGARADDIPFVGAAAEPALERAAEQLRAHEFTVEVAADAAAAGLGSPS
jgi:hypothetical protein